MMKTEMPIEATDLEQKFLACILAHPRSMKKAAVLVRPEYFYRNEHRDMYEVMLALYQQDRHCTLDAVVDGMQRQGTFHEDAAHFKFVWETTLLDTPVGMGDVLALGAILKRKAKMRRLMDASREIAQLAFDEEEDAVEQAEQKICAIMMDADERASTTIASAIDRYMDALEVRRTNAKLGITPGLSTGIFCLDPIFKMLPGELCTIAALTGFGKSALALNIVAHLILYAKERKRVMMCSLEMGEEELIQRILSIDTQVDQSMLSSGRLDGDEYDKIRWSAARLKTCDMVINDSSYGIDEIISKIKFEHALSPLDLVIIDYVQLMESTSKSGRRSENRSQEVERISRRLKQLAQTLHIPVLILSQVNREVEKRQLQEPQLSDLSDSSGVAKNSDRVAFIYCTPEEAENRKQCQAFKVRFKVAKNRSGPIGEEGLIFAPRITRFRDEMPTEEEQTGEYV